MRPRSHFSERRVALPSKQPRKAAWPQRSLPAESAVVWQIILRLWRRVLWQSRRSDALVVLLHSRTYRRYRMWPVRCERQTMSSYPPLVQPMVARISGTLRPHFLYPVVLPVWLILQNDPCLLLIPCLMRVWTRDTFSDPLRFPSLVLVSIFNNIDLNEPKLFMRLIGERKGYNWHKCESKVPAISSPILSRRLRTAARRVAVHDAKKRASKPCRIDLRY